MRPPVIAVTDPEFRKASDTFTTAQDLGCMPVPPNEPDLVAAVRELGARHVVVGILPYKNLLYAALKPRAVIARFGVGHDGIDKTAATRAQLLCTNTPGALDASVAEHTMSLILAAARHTAELNASLRDGHWTPRVGRELGGKHLAIIGCGPIGCAVARMATFGFKMKVTGWTRANRPSLPDGFDRVVTDFAEAVRGADYVSLHIPSTPETRHFINTARLSLMPSTAWLINTARGSVVDEIALYDDLASGALAGAALDVFEREPYAPITPTHDLRLLANAILTPHVASNTEEANRRMAEQALRNIRLAEAGNYASMNLLNPEVL